MAAMARRDLIKLYELANLSSYRRGTLHQHDPRQLPLRIRLHPEEGLADESSMPPPSAEVAPSQAKTASTTPGSLWLDITL